MGEQKTSQSTAEIPKQVLFTFNWSAAHIQEWRGCRSSYSHLGSQQLNQLRKAQALSRGKTQTHWSPESQPWSRILIQILVLMKDLSPTLANQSTWRTPFVIF